MISAAEVMKKATKRVKRKAKKKKTVSRQRRRMTMTDWYEMKQHKKDKNSPKINPAGARLTVPEKPPFDYGRG
jgi:hypothetical protein